MTIEPELPQTIRLSYLCKQLRFVFSFNCDAEMCGHGTVDNCSKIFNEVCLSIHRHTPVKSGKMTEIFTLNCAIHLKSFEITFKPQIVRRNHTFPQFYIVP